MMPRPDVPPDSIASRSDARAPTFDHVADGELAPVDPSVQALLHLGDTDDGS
jgi:hypothetical protein